MFRCSASFVSINNIFSIICAYRASGQASALLCHLLSPTRSRGSTDHERCGKYDVFAEGVGLWDTLRNKRNRRKSIADPEEANIEWEDTSRIRVREDIE